MKEQTKPRSLDTIAQDIYKSWKNMSPFAQPYVQAMMHLTSTKDMYGCDSAHSIVLYFLSNATSWKGEDARRIKAELKDMLTKY